MASFPAIKYLRRVLPPGSPDGVMPKKIAKQCIRFLMHYGIDAELMKDDLLKDALIPPDQFNGAIYGFHLICRHAMYIQGETFFKDARIYRSKDVTPLVVVVGDLPLRIASFAPVHSLPMISTASLGDFCCSLERIRLGLSADYTGPCELLRTAMSVRPITRSEIECVHDQAREADARRDWELSEQYWKRYIDLRNDDWWAYVALAKALAEQGKAAEAALVYSRASRNFPAQPYFLAEEARRAGDAQNWCEAFKIWEEFVRRFPNSWTGYRGLAEAYIARGQSNEAMDVVIGNAPRFMDNLEAMHDYGVYSAQLGDWKSAEDAWRSFIALNDRVSWVYRELAVALIQQSRPGDAYREITRAIERFPDDRSLRLTASFCLETIGVS